MGEGAGALAITLGAGVNLAAANIDLAAGAMDRYHIALADVLHDRAGLIDDRRLTLSGVHLQARGVHDSRLPDAAR